VEAPRLAEGAAVEVEQLRGLLYPMELEVVVVVQKPKLRALQQRRLRLLLLQRLRLCRCLVEGVVEAGV
jgi:hypothetical protein